MLTWCLRISPNKRIGRAEKRKASIKAKAIEHYEKFLDLWKDADPGIAEVDDVRERLAGLKRQ